MSFVPSSSTPFTLVGRDRELAVLRDHLAATLAGQGSLVLIGGEAGIGKTALAEAVCREAADRGALVMVGRCYDLTETPPYGPWVELFDHYRPADGTLMHPAPFSERGTVGEVASQAGLFRQVLDFFIALAAERSLVVLLDDAHWMDAASLDLLRILARSIRASAVLLVATYRSDELTRRHPLYPLIPLLEREGRAERLHLRRLGPDALRSLVGSRYDLPAGEVERLAEYLDERADGNALFALQLLRAFEEDGALRREGEGWTLTNLAHTGVPLALKQVIEGRAVRLDGEVRELLEAAAVIGQEVRLDLWAVVAGAD